eukprot:GFUD01005797.1.p1 GENE.GFUD01005797.1~~GFUD01005797.1.p1  ORF type:complete len:1109 (+),score=391.68 GFUD01005797.1:341-3667(+)
MAPDPRMIRAQRFPLHSAVDAGDLAKTRSLLESQSRCQINRKYDTSGQTPLHIAASTGCPAMVQMLIDAGAKIDEYDSVKQTALHYSMTNTRWGVMETLVKAGADVNCRRMKDGWTPLFLASIFGYSYKAQYLVDSGADVLLADQLGWTPEDWAGKYGLVAVRKIIRGAPGIVTESSGRKYVETEKEDKLEVPVEFDEGISKLLAKIDVKRKAKIEEHKKLFLKIEKEKMEEEKKNKAEQLRLDELDIKAQEENERKLNEATANIIERQKRLEKETHKEEKALTNESLDINKDLCVTKKAETTQNKADPTDSLKANVNKTHKQERNKKIKLNSTVDQAANNLKIINETEVRPQKEKDSSQVTTSNISEIDNADKIKKDPTDDVKAGGVEESHGQEGTDRSIHNTTPDKTVNDVKSMKKIKLTPTNGKVGSKLHESNLREDGKNIKHNKTLDQNVVDVKITKKKEFEVLEVNKPDTCKVETKIILEEQPIAIEYETETPNVKQTKDISESSYIDEATKSESNTICEKGEKLTIDSLILLTDKLANACEADKTDDEMDIKNKEASNTDIPENITESLSIGFDPPDMKRKSSEVNKRDSEKNLPASYIRNTTLETNETKGEKEVHQKKPEGISSGKKLTWEVHSDSFIKCKKKIGTTKDGQSNQSKLTNADMKIKEVSRINKIENSKDPKASLEKSMLDFTKDALNHPIHNETTNIEAGKPIQKHMKDCKMVQNLDTPCSDHRIPQNNSNNNEKAMKTDPSIEITTDDNGVRDIKEASRIITAENSKGEVKYISKIKVDKKNEESDALMNAKEETRLSSEIDNYYCDSKEVTKIEKEEKRKNDENVKNQNDKKGSAKEKELSVDIKDCPKDENNVVTKITTDLPKTSDQDTPANIPMIQDSKVNKETINVSEITKTFVETSSDNVHSDRNENTDSQNKLENCVLELRNKTDVKCDYSKDSKILIPPNQKPEESIKNLVLEKTDNVEDKEAQNSVDDIIQNSDLPEFIEDPEFINRIKVFNNYRNFGAMYSAKKNFRKAEWAFKNGIKQTAGQPARSKDQLRSILTAEIEFRLNRARSLAAMGMEGDAREECQAVLMIDSNNTVAAEMIRSH